MELWNKVSPFITFFCAWHMLVDIVTDGWNVYKIREECFQLNNLNETMTRDLKLKWLDRNLAVTVTHSEDIRCLLWPLSGLVMILPTVFMTFFIACCGGYKSKSVLEKIAFGPFYFISAPLYVIHMAHKELCCERRDPSALAEEEIEIRKARNEKRAFLRGAEGFFEALPQASINLVYFAHFGWPWNGKGGYANPYTNCHPETSKISDCLSFATNWITFVSCGSSILMVMYGTVVGIRALIWMRKRQARQEEKERRIYYNTQEIRERMERREKKTSWTLVDYQEEFKS